MLLKFEIESQESPEDIVVVVAPLDNEVSTKDVAGSVEEEDHGLSNCKHSRCQEHTPLVGAVERRERENLNTITSYNDVIKN